MAHLLLETSLYMAVCCVQVIFVGGGVVINAVVVPLIVAHADNIQLW